MPCAASSDTAIPFAYHRAVAPMMWMLVAIGTVELFVTHVLIAFWNPAIALLLSGATLAALVWLVRGILAMRHRPVSLGRDTLVMQVGTIRRVEIPVDAIADVRTSIDMAAIKHRSVLNLALLAYPNIVVDLVGPLPGRRGIRTIAHRLDDPAAFAAAWKALGADA